MSDDVRLRLLIDTGALALGYYVAMDIQGRIVREFDTEAEVEAFVAAANGTDVETVRGEAAERARMLVQYRENLIRGSRAARKEQAEADARRDGGDLPG